jgi:ubiquinone/menaquinone biosynthesis C-methylase UbiE
MDERAEWPGPADVKYQAEAQAGGFGQTLASFIRFLDLPAGASVLDVGTGPGLAVRTLADRVRFVVGCDSLREMLRQANSLLPGGAHFAGAWLTADALQLPFAPAAFDAALATNLLFLLPDPPAGVFEMARVVRPGGTIGWLNPSSSLTRASAAGFADARGMTGFARFSLINYGRIAEEYHPPTDEAWAESARGAGLTDIVIEGRAGGLMSLLKGRRRLDA